MPDGRTLMRSIEVDVDGDVMEEISLRKGGIVLRSFRNDVQANTSINPLNSL